MRIVARNIAIRDGVGNFVFSMAATLHAYGIPARLYAYVSCPEYAGMVSPICDLSAEMEPDDILYYHYSTEDEFLSDILALKCQKKILYYHNVTPGFWFKEYNPELADALERAICQHSLFAAFDAVVANSRFSLENVLPHIDGAVPMAVFPPTLFPEKLTAVSPEPIQLPDNWRVVLWVGRLTPHKRPEMALRLFEDLASSHADAALVMVGGGKHDFPALFSQFEAQLAALPVAIRERILLLEGISDNQLAWLYRRACLFLCTSGHEGYCLPVTEALQFGLPVAAMPQKAVVETLGGQGTILPVDLKAAATVLAELFTHLKDVRIAARTQAQEANAL